MAITKTVSVLDLKNEDYNFHNRRPFKFCQNKIHSSEYSESSLRKVIGLFNKV